MLFRSLTLSASSSRPPPSAPQPVILSGGVRVGSGGAEAVQNPGLSQIPHDGFLLPSVLNYSPEILQNKTSVCVCVCVCA